MAIAAAAPVVASVVVPYVVGKLFGGGHKGGGGGGAPTPNANLDTGQQYALDNRASYVSGRGFR